MAEVEAVVFDMDGVIVDTEAAYCRILMDFFGRHGVPLGWDEAGAIVGCAAPVYRGHLERWLARVPRPDPAWAAMGAEEVVEPAFSVLDGRLGELAMPGLHRCLDGLCERGIPCAVASCSSPAEIAEALDGCGVRDRFAAVVSGHEVARSKPAPDVYLEAARLLGVDPRRCVAVEDSDTGIEAARAAGLFVVARRETRFGFSQGAAHRVVDRLDELLAVVDGLPIDTRGR